MFRRKTILSPNNNDWLLYNASEYTVNGKTYRNLEAEVLYNHNLSEQNAEDIDALEGRMDTAEEDIDALEGRMDTAEGRLDALGKTVKVAVMGETTFAQIKAWHDGNYTVIGTKPYTGNGHSYYILDNISPTQAKFVRVYDYVIGAYIVDDEDNWTFAYEDLASIDYVLGAIDDRIVTSVDATSDNLHVPSARALWQQAAKYAKCKRFVGTSTEGGPIYLLNNNIADIYNAIHFGGQMVFIYDTFTEIEYRVTYCYIDNVDPANQKIVVYGEASHVDTETQPPFGFSEAYADHIYIKDAAGVNYLYPISHAQSEGGGSGGLKVNITYQNSTYTADKTLSEIQDAIANGQDVHAVVNNTWFFRVDTNETDFNPHVIFSRSWTEDDGEYQYWNYQTLTVYSVSIVSDTITNQVVI